MWVCWSFAPLSEFQGSNSRAEAGNVKPGIDFILRVFKGLPRVGISAVCGTWSSRGGYFPSGQRALFGRIHGAQGRAKARTTLDGVAIRGYETPAVFSRSFLRSAKILMQNCAILRNALRMLNRQTPSVGNAV